MPPPLLQTLCLLALAACATLVHAQTQTPIYRCVGAHGEPEFSGHPCGTTSTPMAGTGADTNAVTASHGLGNVCPASPEALRQAIAGAFESRDVNRLAGVIVWRGVDQASARAMLRTLGEWLKQPLAGIAIARAAGPPLGDTDLPPTTSAGVADGGPMIAPPPIGFEISTAGGGTRNFGVTESDGCWWLTFD